MIIIDIRVTAPTADKSSGSPHLGLPEHNFEVLSNVKPTKAEEYHLGFRTYRNPSRWFRSKGDKYCFIGWNQPFSYTKIKIGLFNITCTNNGDGQMLVGLRLPYGMKKCCMYVLQGDKPAIEVEPYVRFEECIYYQMAIINALQSVHIEGGEN
jgi:hypothetical protein